MKSTDLRELYQQLILDHAKHPRNFGEPSSGACFSAVGRNPLCGDNIRIFLDVRDGVVNEATFNGDGCAISKASASLMTESMKGKTVEQAQALFRLFHEMLTGEKTDDSGPAPANGKIELGKLAVFAGVHEFPSRVKCASLAWHTMQAALTESGTTVTTESAGKSR